MLNDHGLELTEDYWQAIIQNNAAYDGVFFYAVRTTGIFCRPSCRSRRPNRENVRVFRQGTEAISAGFHACKRCQPDQLQPPRQEWVQGIAALIEQRYAEKLNLEELSQASNLSPFHLQRSFKEICGCSPTGYLQSIRLRKAAELLRETDKTISRIGIEVGMSNPAYLATLFKKKYGLTPRAYRQQIHSLKKSVR